MTSTTPAAGATATPSTEEIKTATDDLRATADAAKATTSTRKTRGAAKTGNPVADREADELKAANAAEVKAAREAKAAAAKAAREAKAAEKAAAKAAKDAEPKAPRPTRDEQIAALTEKLGEKLPAGYEIQWPHASHSLVRRAKDAEGEGPTWLVLCNEHGRTTPAESAKDGEAKGRKADRAVWCAGCKRAAAKAADAPATAPATDDSAAK
jgi:colicin import membrane protein